MLQWVFNLRRSLFMQVPRRKALSPKPQISSEAAFHHSCNPFQPVRLHKLAVCGLAKPTRSWVSLGFYFGRLHTLWRLGYGEKKIDLSDK